MSQHPPTMHPLRRLPFALCVVMSTAACGPKPVVVVAPVLDAEQAALALEDHTSLEQPIRIVFDWELNEEGVRVRGRGVARIEPPYKARLDLFLGNGETVVKAALVNGELRLPPWAPKGLLPPPDLMWGTLGVFRPELGTELIGADEIEGGSVRLRYRYADGNELHYVVHEGRMRAMELRQGSHVVQRVEVEMEAESRYPRSATYRNLAEFRELKLTRDRIDNVEPYPPDIWDPGRGGAP